ncbi:MAG: 3-methyladenine DNA glycosylase [Mycobacteriaceae bacterium]|nr:3-methyladenine DNA glycosylase [Mycobacteriaceae bacterium]
MPELVLAEAEWTARERAHGERLDTFLRQRYVPAGHAHPVWDFLFTYYSLQPRQLRRWHPGYGVLLAGPGARRYLGRTGYARSGDGVAVTAEHLRARADTVRFIADLLRATAARPAQLNCFGLHEWAMVYRAGSVRHAQVALRLGPAGTDAVVESMPLRCTHFDAYRFFTPAARPRNVAELSRDTQAGTEQPGCVHAAMDLYKWCYKLGPLVDSGLLLDCLELAADARALDMRASPYDLADYGFTPIEIDQPAGRVEYVRIQRAIAARAVPLRETLANRCDLLLTAATGD